MYNHAIYLLTIGVFYKKMNVVETFIHICTRLPKQRLEKITAIPSDMLRARLIWPKYGLLDCKIIV